MVCNQHGHQQDVHAKGLSRCMTSLPCASVISIPKGRIGPQHCLAQQPDFSFALYTSCPIELRILYLFLVSKPVMASSTSTFCFTSSWSTWDKYSRPRGTVLKKRIYYNHGQGCATSLIFDWYYKKNLTWCLHLRCTQWWLYCVWLGLCNDAH